MIYALIAVSLLFVLAAGYGLGQDEQNEILEAKNREQTATIDAQACTIRELKDDEANLLVQLQSAHHREADLCKKVEKTEETLKDVQRQLKNLKATSSRKQNQYLRIIRNMQRWIIRHDFKRQADFREMGITKAVDVAIRELKDE